MKEERGDMAHTRKKKKKKNHCVDKGLGGQNGIAYWVFCRGIPQRNGP